MVCFPIFFVRALLGKNLELLPECFLYYKVVCIVAGQHRATTHKDTCSLQSLSAKNQRGRLSIHWGITVSEKRCLYKAKYVQVVLMKVACTRRCHQSCQFWSRMSPELKTPQNTQDQRPTVNERPVTIRTSVCVRKLEVDVKLLLSVEGAGYAWGITVSCITREWVYCLVIFYCLYMHNLNNSSTS